MPHRTVVVCVKPGAPASPLIDLASKALQDDGLIHLVSLIAPDAEDDEELGRQALEANLAELAAEPREQGYTVSTSVTVTEENTGRVVARVAEEHEADLVAVGLTKRSRASKALLGSDAQAVLLQSPCPVLTMRLA